MSIKTARHESRHRARTYTARMALVIAAGAPKAAVCCPFCSAASQTFSEELATMDSSGIGLLSRLLTLSKQQGGSLKLVNPSKFVVQTLKLVGLLNLFEVFPETQAAAASFS